MQKDRIPLPALLLLLLACAGETEVQSGAAAPVLIPELVMTVGVVEGDTRYMFQDISAAVRLRSGDLVIADRGTSEISLYDPRGIHKRTFGGMGDGPGEFQNIAGLYAIDGDSVVVVDGFAEYIAVADTSGNVARSLRYADLPGDALFPLGTWIVDRYLVHGHFTSSERTRVNRVLAQRVVPGDGPGFRKVLAEPDGLVWLQEPTASSGASWIGLDENASAVAWIDLPEDFTPLAFYPDAVLGRALDSLDVHSLRIYAMGDASASRAVPAWLVQSAEPKGGATGGGWAPGMLAEHIRSLAGSQEIHYATHSTYSASTDSLAWSAEEVDVAITQADARGWIGVFTSPSEPTVCAMAYGFPIPPGWRMGQLLCGEMTPG